jgi:uncharacterized protein (UPF0332 family)/predicted nucleotidyltransferase
MNEKLIPILTKLYNGLEAIYRQRLQHLILFGSYARDEAENGSDIDVLVVLEGDVNPFKEVARSGELLAELSLEFDEVISCFFVADKTFYEKSTPLLLNVYQEGLMWPTFQPIRPAPPITVQETNFIYNTTTLNKRNNSRHLSGNKASEELSMTPDQAALLQKAADSLKAAKLLANQQFYDFAASRAYYAMFYIADAFLLGEGLSSSKHSTIVAKFGQYFAKTGRVPVEFHRYLIEAQNSRTIGDYSIRTNLDSDEVFTHISRAEQFLELAKQFIGPISPTDS